MFEAADQSVRVTAGSVTLYEVSFQCFPGGDRRLVDFIPSLCRSFVREVEILQALLRRPPIVTGNALVPSRPYVNVFETYAVEGRRHARVDREKHDVGSISRALGRRALGKRLQFCRLLSCVFHQWTEFGAAVLTRDSSAFTEGSPPGLEIAIKRRLLGGVRGRDIKSYTTPPSEMSQMKVKGR